MEALEILEKLVSFQTESSQTNWAMTEYIKNQLLGAGFDPKSIRTTTDISASGVAKHSLIATKGKTSRAGLVLAGHMDTVSAGPRDLWRSDPFKMTARKDRLYGLGICDMKFFLAAAMTVVSELNGDELKLPVTLVFTHDEETSMHGAKVIKHDNLVKAKYAVVGEPTNLVPVRVHKGYVEAEFTITGKRGHASNPGNGLSAIEQAYGLLTALFQYQEDLKEYNNPLLDPPYPTINIGQIAGGENINKIPGECVVKLEVRPIPGQSILDITNDLKKVAESLGKFQGRPIVQVRFNSAPTETMETAADSLIVKVAEKVTGQASIGVPFTTEAAIYNSMGIETIVLGPGNIAVVHQPNEYIEASVVPKTLAVLREIVSTICVQPAQGE